MSLEEDPFGFDDAGAGAGGAGFDGPGADPFQSGDDDAAFGDAAFAEDGAYVPPAEAPAAEGEDPFAQPAAPATAAAAAAPPPPQQQQQQTKAALGKAASSGAASVGALDENSTNAQSKFDRKWQGELADKDSKNAAKRAEMKAAAHKELAQFYDTKRAGSASKAKANRAREAEFMTAINDALTAENPWDRISSMVDVSSTAADKEEGKSDVSRLRGLIIQLKNSGAQK